MEFNMTSGIFARAVHGHPTLLEACMRLLWPVKKMLYLCFVIRGIMTDSRLRIIVTGMVGLYPVGGVAWDYLQYVVGLARLDTT